MTTTPGHTNEFPLVPPEAERCVWMTAGVVSYQLCDRNFDCDRCPLDAAIRMNFRRRNTPAASVGTAKTGLRQGYLYTRNHCWLKQRAQNIVRMGIEPSFASALVSIKAIAFPTAGERLRRKQVCLWIVLEGGTYPVLSPVSGIVLSTNGILAEAPHELHLNPFDQGWLLDLEVEEGGLEATACMNDRQAELRFDGDAARFKELLVQALPPTHSDVGRTLADGGMPYREAWKAIGARKYFALLAKAYR